ncbi:MAG: lamin tail domain-containing protein [Alphaproteobacteria bacterium]|nr:lamin tail domain-containing protein [Alphaproteobacteria bacterium]
MTARIPSLVLLCTALLASCGEKDEVTSTGLDDTTPGEDTYPSSTDADLDGVAAEDGDCDDANPEVYPGRGEDCNGVDDNCNGLTDEGFGDGDLDGIADCLDTEECDGYDNDGDGQADEGFINENGEAECDPEEIGCDDLDNDRDGAIDEGFDADGDGYDACDDDCDDSDAGVNPGAEEVDGDNIDNDCDGLSDEGEFAEGALVITEIMNNPAAVADPLGEWFEVWNPGETDFVLNGLWITSGANESHQISSSETISVPAGGYLILGNNGSTATNGGVTVDYVYTDIFLSNESDELSIGADGVALDTVVWDDGGSMPDPDGASMSVDPAGYGADLNEDPSIWCASTYNWASRTDLGSPAADNEICSTFDHDGDGFSRDEGDCNDEDATIYPNAPEIDGAVDNDCDGDAELMPTAVADYDSSSSSLLHCDYVYLDGSGSSDPDGSSLTYSWELTSAPSSSALTTADLNSPTSMNPTFTPDQPGTYVFTLTVNDGGTDSFPVDVSVDITSQTTNIDPVADAGDDQTYSESSTCQSWSYGAYYTCADCGSNDFTLDAMDSYDANSSDHMTYSWSVTSNSSYASLSDATDPSATVTVSGVGATYGSTNTVTVTMSLQVTDCYGATSTADTVDLNYECTGI